MDNVVSLQAHREKRLAQDHVRALVLYECAATLARRGDASLIALVNEAFGDGYLEQRVSESLQQTHTPKRKAPARR